MHRLEPLGCYRRRVEVEGDLCVTVLQRKRIRRDSVHGEISCVDSSRIYCIAQVDNKICRLSAGDAIASWVAGGHCEADQLPVSKRVLLGGATNSHAAVVPCSDVLGEQGGA